TCSVTLHPSFFDGHATYPDFHSFPTRRSSDLARRARYAARRPLREGVERWSLRPPLTAARRWPCGDGEDRTGGRRRSSRAAPARSEEHTSELQSPYDLVCRLLLEKKKIIDEP